MDKKILLLILVLCWGISGRAQGDFTWAEWKNITSKHDNTIWGIARDASGNIISTGYARESGANKVVVYAHDKDGTFLWDKRWDLTQGTIARVVASADASGNVYLVITFRGKIEINGTEYASGLSNANDLLLVKMDASQTVEWALLQGHPNYGEQCRKVICDDAGNLYLAGEIGYYGIFGGDTLFGDRGAGFIAKYGTDNSYKWSTMLGGDCRGVAVTSQGVYGTGSLGIGVNSFGDSTFASPVSGGYVAQYDASNGSFSRVAIQQSINHSNVVNRDLASDDQGGLYLTGFNNDKILVGSDTLSASNSTDAYLIRYDGNLDHQSNFQIQGTDWSNGTGVAVSKNGSYALLGQYAGDITFAGVTLNESTGFSHDVFVLEFDNTGAEKQAYQIKGEAASTQTELESAGMVSGANGDYYVNGYFKGKCVAGTKTLQPGGLFAGEYVMFAAQIGDAGNVPGPSSVTEIGSDAFWSVYPNPFDQTLNLTISSNEMYTLSLYTLLGEEMTQISGVTGNFQWNLSDLPAGVYLLQVRDQQYQTLEIKRVVKK